MKLLRILLLILAVIIFAAAATGVKSHRLDLIPLGLACWALAELLVAP